MIYFALAFASLAALVAVLLSVLGRGKLGASPEAVAAQAKAIARAAQIVLNEPQFPATTVAPLLELVVCEIDRVWRTIRRLEIVAERQGDWSGPPPTFAMGAIAPLARLWPRGVARVLALGSPDRAARRLAHLTAQLRLLTEHLDTLRDITSRRPW